MAKPANVVCDGDVCRVVGEPAPAPASTATTSASNPLTKLLGTDLTGQDNATVPVSSISGSGKYIGLYFSAHWCPPCRGFTPQLAKAYTAFQASHPLKDSFNIVFVSSDKSEEAFDEYFKEMPWLALPYKARDLKGKLSSKFKVQGIPTFVILDAETGAVICRDGRSALAKDPEFKEFPWAPKPFKDVITGDLVDKTGATVSAKEALDGKVTLLYFSAHWCPPCRGFTPKLVETYNKLKADGKDVEVVFVSGDRSKAQYDEYLAEMPWKAVPYESQALNSDLNELFEVEGIPALIIIDDKGNVINTEGRRAVMKDPEGASFPWIPAPPLPLDKLSEDNIDQINEGPLVILALEKEEGAQGRAEGLLNEFAMELKKGEDADELNFLWGVKSDDLMKRVLGFLDVSGEGDVLMLVDLSQEAKFVSEGELTQEVAVSYVKKFLADELELKPLGN